MTPKRPDKRPIAIVRQPSGVWVMRQEPSPYTQVHVWWRWIRLWPLPVSIKKRPSLLRKQ